MVRKNQYRNELISEIKTLAQSNGLNTVFTTFLEITATSIAAQMDPQNAEEREKRYQEIASKMTPEMLSSYARMFALLTLVTRAHAEDPCDILGDIYHELRLNNEWNGQFFTPDHICRLMAQLANVDVPEDKEGPITINEPTCGSGTMVIGAVWAMQRKNIPMLLKETPHLRFFPVPPLSQGFQCQYGTELAKLSNRCQKRKRIVRIF